MHKGVDKVPRECALLTWAQPWQGHRCLKLMRMAKPSSGLSGNADSVRKKFPSPASSSGASAVLWRPPTETS